MKIMRPITSWDDVPIVMDLAMASRIVGTSPEALKLRCLRGTFPGYKEGKLWRVERESLREYISARTIKMPAANETA